MVKPGDLELAFHERMGQIYEQAKTECNYTATRFMQLVNAEGGASGCKKTVSFWWIFGRIDAAMGGE
jgi:hypothetical protein